MGEERKNPRISCFQDSTQINKVLARGIMYSGRSRGEAGVACPAYFWTKLRLERPKTNFLKTPPPPPPPSKGLDPPMMHVPNLNFKYGHFTFWK